MRVEFQLVTFAARLARRDFWLEKCVSVRCQLFLGVECCATFQAALYIETHSMMHQSEFDATNVALSRAADKRKSLINIHKNRYTATLKGLHIEKHFPYIMSAYTDGFGWALK